MGKLRKAFLIFFALILLSVLGYLAFEYFKPKAAGIYIETNPASSIYINGEQIGKTPFRKTRNPGEIVLKLIPDSFETPLVPYETKINLVAGVETVVRRDFGESDENSSGEVISFEKGDKGKTILSVVSVPDLAQITIDGRDRNFTPYKTTSILPGEHKILISAQGYKDKTINVKAEKGFNLTLIVTLAIDETAEEVESQNETVEEEEVVTQVRILSTSVGFLRVREEPTTLSAELARVEPGDVFEMVEEDEETGWYKIEYEEGSFGWVSNSYAEIVKDEEEGATPSPSPTST